MQALLAETRDIICEKNFKLLEKLRILTENIKTAKSKTMAASGSGAIAVPNLESLRKH